MATSKDLGAQATLHKKQISIESRVEQVVSTKTTEVNEKELCDGSSTPKQCMSEVSVVISSVKMDDEHGSGDDMQKHTSLKNTFITYITILILTATTASLKLSLAPLSFVLTRSTPFQNSCLTGIPILIGTCTFLLTAVFFPAIGKRILLLVGVGIMLVGSIWNLLVREKRYTEILGARGIQGIGWGIVEAVLAQAVGSIDTKNPTLHQNIFMAVNVCFTWSSSVFSGYLASTTTGIGFRQIYLPHVIVQSISIAWLVLCMFMTRNIPSGFLLNQNTPTISDTTSPPTDTQEPNLNLKLNTSQTTITSTSTSTPSTSSHTQNISLQPLKALLTPTAILQTLLLAPLSATSLGLATSLSFLFANITPRSIGEMFALPIVFGMVVCCVAVAVAFSAFSTRGGNKRVVGLRGFRLQASHSNDYGKEFKGDKKVKGGIVVLAILIGAAGILFFGCYTSTVFGKQIWDFAKVEEDGSSIANGSGKGWVVGMEDLRMWWWVGGLFGLVVGGAVALGVLALGGLSSSSSKVGGEGKEVEKCEIEVQVQIHGATHFYTNLLGGVFVLLFPMWIDTGAGVGTEESLKIVTGLKTLSIALPIVVCVVSGAAGVALVFGGVGLGRRDVKVLGLELGVEGKDGEEDGDC